MRSRVGARRPARVCFAWNASVANASIKLTMGNGTSIEWIECFATCAVGCRFSLYVKGGLFRWRAGRPFAHRSPKAGVPKCRNATFDLEPRPSALAIRRVFRVAATRGSDNASELERIISIAQVLRSRHPYVRRSSRAPAHRAWSTLIVRGDRRGAIRQALHATRGCRGGSRAE
jgi:hypothetical protein